MTGSPPPGLRPPSHRHSLHPLPLPIAWREQAKGLGGGYLAGGTLRLHMQSAALSNYDRLTIDRLYPPGLWPPSHRHPPHPLLHPLPIAWRERAKGLGGGYLADGTLRLHMQYAALSNDDRLTIDRIPFSGLKPPSHRHPLHPLPISWRE